jgi:hypothetical protein
VPENLPAFKRRRATSGVSWETVDGGTLRNIMVRDAHIDRVDSPIFLRIGNRQRNGGAPGSISHIIFQHITGSDNGQRGSIIAGIPGAKVKDVMVRNLNLAMAGGGSTKRSETIPENIADYPDSNMFGEVTPALGFWMRHAEGVWFEQVVITPKKSDERPEFLAGDDVFGVMFNGAEISQPIRDDSLGVTTRR